MGFNSFEQWDYLSEFSKKFIYLINNIINYDELNKKDSNYATITYFKKIYDNLFKYYTIKSTILQFSFPS